LRPRRRGGAVARIDLVPYSDAHRRGRKVTRFRIPHEILEHDCGCGSAWRWARAGETALDLGCGSGKTCFLLSQAVGPAGRVIGIDASPALIAVAQRGQPALARALGWSNVRFVEAKIDGLDVEPRGADLVVLDCVLTFVQERDRPAVLAAAARALRPGGRAIVSDVLRDDLEGIPEALAAAGFEPVEVLERSDEILRVIDGVPRRATTLLCTRSRRQ
jgi:ubiquinone/menaquinone biosynthesis C-methylase UbiE